MNPNCKYCDAPYQMDHVCDSLQSDTAQTIADLRAKTANLLALSRGVAEDLAVRPHTDRTRNRLNAMQAHLAQAQDMADLLQAEYPLKGLPK